MLASACFLLVGNVPSRAAEGGEGCDPRAFPAERKRMVREQIEARGVKDARVLAAMGEVGRHCFVPKPFRDESYADHPLPIGKGQTVSQPYIVARMTELLRLRPTDRVLEIGTGSGYQSAVLAQVAGSVFSVEIHPSLAEGAALRLKELGFRNVQVRQGDGYNGWEANAPFDAIMVTAAASGIPPPLVRQLKPGGRMVIPVGGVYQVQQLTLVEKDEEGAVSTRALLPVRFVPLVRGR